MRKNRSAIMIICLICEICLAQTSSRDEYIDYLHYVKTDSEGGYLISIFRLHSNGTLLFRTTSTQISKKETSPLLYNKTLRYLDNCYFNKSTNDKSDLSWVTKDVLCLIDTKEKAGVDGYHGKGLFVIAHIKHSKIRFVTIYGAPRRGPFVKIRKRLKMAKGVTVNVDGGLDIDNVLFFDIDLIYHSMIDIFHKDNSGFIIFDGINNPPKDSIP